MNFSIVKFLFWTDLKTRWRRYLLLGLSVSLSLCALSALDLFSRRIGNTISQDTRKLLAADLQIQAWRDPSPELLASVSKLSGQGNMIQQSDFLSTAFFEDGQASTVAVRALEGNFPFYGNFRSDPQTPIENLRSGPLALVDSALKARGYKIGDRFDLGKVKFEIAGFVLEEPQTVASALAAGPRVIIHQTQARQTGLMSRGARVFNMLLIKTQDSPKEFVAKFRQAVPDPHWRIITPERANAQAERVINRIRGFLSLVALVGIVLGALGVFVVFRSQFFLQLPQFGALRCLGLGRKELLSFLFLQGLVVSLIGVALGGFGGYYLEQLLSQGARSYLDIGLSDVHFAATFLLCFLVAFLTVGLATLLPALELVSIPILQALRNSAANSQQFGRKQSVAIFALTALLCLGISRSLELSAYFMLIFSASTLLLSLLGWFLLRSTDRHGSNLERPLVVRHTLLSISREKRGPLLIFVCLGLGVFLVSTLLFVSHSLKEQVNVSHREGIPNLILLGVTPEMKDDLAADLLKEAAWTPVTLARLESIKGESIVERNEDSEDVFDREQRLRTREYTITRRNALTSGEELVKGKTLFGEADPSVVRASLEVEFAERIKMSLGDHFTMLIAGIPVEARVDSLRKVKWNNFQPNFFIVVQNEDLAGAPLDFVGLSRVKTDEISSYQQRISRKYPEITVLDGNAISQRLLKLMDQLGYAVQSIGLFALGSCILVFLGILLSRRQSKILELALLRTLGLGSTQVKALFVLEILALCLGALGLAFGLSYASYVFINLVYLDVPTEALPLSSVGLFYLALLGFLLMLGFGMFRKLLKEHPLRVLREADEA